VTVFDRDPATGGLTWVEAKVDGEDGVSLGSVRHVVVSADGTHVFVAASSGKTTIFTGDAGTGRLEFVNVTPDGFTLAESPDGRDAHLSGNEFVFHFRAYSGCDELPAMGCRTLGASGSAKLALKVETLDGATDVMKWTWRRGDPTVIADFDDPVTSIDYAFCLYDESAPTPALVQRTLIPSGDRGWTEARNGFTFKDGARDGRGPEGIELATLRATTGGRARLVVKGRGPRLRDVTLPLPLPLRAQLQASNGTCWEATYPTGRVRRNAGQRFAARAD
jgi:hypothetical protein